MKSKIETTKVLNIELNEWEVQQLFGLFQNPISGLDTKFQRELFETLKEFMFPTELISQPIKVK